MIPAGEPDPKGRCGEGACAGTCSGSWGSCSYDVARPCGRTATCDKGMFTPAGHCAASGAYCEDWMGPQPCAGGTGCKDPLTCNGPCTTAAQCAGPFDRCLPSGQCEPDAAAKLATQRGITNVTWVSPPRPESYSAEQLEKQGLVRGPNGIIAMRDYAFHGIAMAYDPNLKDALGHFRECLTGIQLCTGLNASRVDGCVAARPRCNADPPWQSDASFCCPESCLTEYLEARSTKSPADAFLQMSRGACYPGYPVEP